MWCLFFFLSFDLIFVFGSMKDKRSYLCKFITRGYFVGQWVYGGAAKNGCIFCLPCLPIALLKRKSNNYYKKEK